LFTDVAKALKAHFSDYEGDGLALIEADLQLANLERLDYGAAAKALRASLDQLAEYFDVCIIDTAPSLGVAMTAAVLAGDFVLSPVEMEAYSIHGMKKLVQVIANLRQSNPGLQFMGMLPNKVDRRKPRHVANLEALRDAYPDYVLPVSVGSRDSIAEALGEQRPVWAIKKTAARVAIKEMRAVAQHVFEKMEIEQ
jgi:chromosome partitioning protein